MTATTRPTRKMSISQLRDLARLNEITGSLYGTGKQALVIMIAAKQRSSKTA